MDLDKLKDLEHRLTGLKLVDIKHDCGHGKLFFVYDDNRTVYLTDMDVADTCALRNQAKEMIETIERYKGALKYIRDRELLKAVPEMTDSSDPFDKGVVRGLNFASDTAANALIGPEKTVQLPMTAGRDRH